MGEPMAKPNAGGTPAASSGGKSQARAQPQSQQGVPKAAGAAAAGASGAEASSGAEPEKQQPSYQGSTSALKVLVPVKNLVSCYLLLPAVLGECRSERRCMPWLNVMLLAADVAAFSGHLLVSLRHKSYRERLQVHNFYILLVFWSLWNFCSHPLCRQYGVDLFVEAPELHVAINVVAIAAASSALMAPPSMRHLIGLITWEFAISLVLSSIEVVNSTMESGWLTVVRVDIVMFNIAILLVGSTIIVGTMTVEKDIKNLAQEVEHRFGSAGSFEDDLERRKRAVLTALCDAVLTTNANFQVTGSDDCADRFFRRPMANELFTDYFKDEAEKERFLAAVRKQFPADTSIGEGPKRMRVTLRDDDDELFEADVVVSDASTDKDGKVNKYMVGMHIRGEHRARALDASPLDSRSLGRGASDRRRENGMKDRRRENGMKDLKGVASEKDKEKSEREAVKEAAAEARVVYASRYDELHQELLLAFEGALRPAPPPLQCVAEALYGGADAPPEQPSLLPQQVPGSAGPGTARQQPPLPPAQQQQLQQPLQQPLQQEQQQWDGRMPQLYIRRANCEVFRRRTPALNPTRPGGDRHPGAGDLRRLSLPEPAGGLM